MSLCVTLDFLKTQYLLTLNSCTPMQANMNCSRVVTIMMLPIVRMATNTHCTTCCENRNIHVYKLWCLFCTDKSKIVVFNVVKQQDGFVMRFHLQAFSSVDGPQGAKNTKNPKNLHHWDGRRPEQWKQMGAVLVLKQDILEKFLKLFGQNGLKLGIHNNNNLLRPKM